MYLSYYEAMDGMSDEEFGRCARALFKYAFRGEKTNLTGAAKIILTMAMPQIDATIVHRENGRLGGRPQSESPATRRKTSPAKKTEVSAGAKPRFPQAQNPGFQNSETNVDVNENLDANENGGEGMEMPHAGASAQGASVPSLPSSSAPLTKQQTATARWIHSAYTEAGLPCSDYISFLQGEYMRGLRTIHEKLGSYRIKPKDMLAAIHNYASVVNDPGDYWHTKMTFDRLVAHKLFPDFLPSAFVKGNWKKRSKDGGDDAPAAAPEPQYDFSPCPSCGRKTLVWNVDKQEFTCASCGKTHTWEDVNGKEAANV